MASLELELIGKQQLEIEELKKQVKESDNCYKLIRQKMVAIGGPLNDNYLGFNKDQLKFIQDIYYLAGGR